MLAYSAKPVRSELTAWWGLCDGSQVTIAQSLRAKQIWRSSPGPEMFTKYLLKFTGFDEST